MPINPSITRLWQHPHLATIVRVAPSHIYSGKRGLLVESLLYENPDGTRDVICTLDMVPSTPRARTVRVTLPVKAIRPVNDKSSEWMEVHFAIFKPLMEEYYENPK